MYDNLHRKLPHNDQLTVSERKNLIHSMAERKLLHGSGHWALKSENELRSYHASCMRSWRKACRPLLGVSSLGATDKEVCCMHGVLLPLERLATERIKCMAKALACDEGFLQHVLIEGCGIPLA